MVKSIIYAISLYNNEWCINIIRDIRRVPAIFVNFLKVGTLVEQIIIYMLHS